MGLDMLWWLQLGLYFAFGATLGFNGILILERPVAFFALFGLFLVNDIVSHIRGLSSGR